LIEKHTGKSLTAHIMDDQRRLVHSSDEKEEIRKTLNMANGMRVNGKQ
jgi:hypothetical protein